MTLPRYLECRDSEIPWVGKVPKHWQILPLIGVAAERYESNTGMQEDNLLSLSYGRIVRKDIDSNDGLLPESFETYQVVHRGDIVLRLTDLQNDKRSLRSAQVRERGIITSAYLALQPTGIFPTFLSHLMRAYDTKKVFYSMGGGLRQSMKFSDLKRMPIALPPESEQEAIATFLDHETTKIDALVEAQRRLIELLKEKRLAVISQAVTKGLNPNAPMKDSGATWLGQVPSVWTVAPLKRRCSLLKDGTHLPPARVADGIPLLSVRNVQRGTFSKLDDDSMISEENYEALCRSFVPQANDVLLAIVGATLGKTALVPSGMGHFHIQRSLAIFRPSGELTASWLYLVFQSVGFQSLLWKSVGFSAQPGIYLGTLAEIDIAVPPSDIQSAILSVVSQSIQRLDELLTEAALAVDLLQERRSALISAAVTGKIDVRGLVPLPEAAAA